MNEKWYYFPCISRKGKTLENPENIDNTQTADKVTPEMVKLPENANNNTQSPDNVTPQIVENSENVNNTPTTDKVTPQN